MAGAREWIGQRADGAPKDRLDGNIKVDPAAADLKSILELERVKTLFTMRTDASSKASNAQKSFKRATAAVIAGGALAAVASALLLYGAGSGAGAATPAAPPEKINEWVLAWVSRSRIEIIALQVLGLAVSAVAAVVLSQLKYADVWAENRKKAEGLRPDIFNTVLDEAQKRVKVQPGTPDPDGPICQAMEFFRRYQHQLQIAYYNEGSERHWSANVRWTWVAAGLAAVAAVIGPIGGLGSFAQAVGAFLGIAVPILIGSVQSWRVASGDSDKAAAYATAGAALQEIMRTEVDTVRERAAMADAAAVRAYFDKVHLVMTTERDAWKATGTKQPTKA